MLTYRFATLNENFDHLAEVGLQAISELTPHKDTHVDAQTFKETIKGFVGSPQGALLLVLDDIRVVGVLAFVITRNLLVPDKVVANEVLLWIDRDYRKIGVFNKMLRIYESGAKAAGCNQITLACYDPPEEDKIAKLYKHCGFKRFETTYAKDLN